MIDQCQELLLNSFQSCRVNTPNATVLWVLDENTADLCSRLSHERCYFLTNRWDIYTQLDEKSSNFSDYNFDDYKNIDTIYFRVPKEKAVTHHIINASFNALKDGGQLIFSGEKNDGVKTYEKKAKLLFGNSSLEKHKNGYRVTLTKTTHAQADQLLDDQNYSDLRETTHLGDIPCYSKPGIFGWNKIDQGSELLLRLFSHHKKGEPSDKPVLDLGCGWGYLAISLVQLGFTNIDASDNNAGTIIALEKTITENNLPINVWADNCAETKRNQYDLIVCNPPFHKGFDHSYPLTETFLNAIKRLLTKNGTAFIVVNQFIPVEKFASKYFSCVELLTTENGFKVFALS